jgi:CRISPR/Cas system CSM-associated protein Csm2 small subunit
MSRSCLHNVTSDRRNDENNSVTLQELLQQVILNHKEKINRLNEETNEKINRLNEQINRLNKESNDTFEIVATQLKQLWL